MGIRLVPRCARLLHHAVSDANGLAISCRATSLAPSWQPAKSYPVRICRIIASSEAVNRPTSLKDADPSSLPVRVRASQATSSPRHLGIRLVPASRRRCAGVLSGSSSLPHRLQHESAPVNRRQPASRTKTRTAPNAPVCQPSTCSVAAALAIGPTTIHEASSWPTEMSS